MKEIEYIILLHDIDEEKSIRIDGRSTSTTNAIIERLKQETYNMLQFVKHEFLVEIGEYGLDQSGIEYDVIPRTKKTWFGLGNKIVNDIIIYDSSNYTYPYNYGNFLYYYSEENIGKTELINWMNSNKINSYFDLDDIYSAMNNYQTSLLNSNDFLLVTNHDKQTEFGISANTKIIESLLKQIQLMNFTDYEENYYKQTQKR